MTLTPPVIAPVSVNGLGISYLQPQDLQPFSYRSTMTYTELLNTMRNWLTDTLVPYLDSGFTDVENAWEDNIQVILQSVDTALNTQAGNITTALAAQQAAVAANLASTLAQIVAGTNAGLFDAQVKAALQVASSQSLALLDTRYDARYATPSSVTAVATNVAGNTTAIGTINSALSGRLSSTALDTAYGDAGVAALIKTPSSALGITIQRRLGVFVDDYGAIADGSTDDTTAVQAAFTAVAAAGGTVYFGRGRTYAITGAIKVSAGTTVEFNGATVKKVYAAGANIYATFVNAHGTSTGYGSGAGSLVFRNGTIKGDYTASTLVDCAVALLHADTVLFENMTFQEGKRTGHYLDLGGCRYVTVRGCAFLGSNPDGTSANKEAIQIDVATRDGSSNFSGTNAWPSTVYDGLPTRHVIVEQNSFRAITVAGTDYPMPNPIGCHSAALTTDAGYFEDIKFVDNTAEGWTTPPADGSTLGYGWVHFRGTRNLRIVGNTFRDTGTTGRSGYPTIINVTDAPIVVAEGDTGTQAAPTTTLGTTRYGYDTLIEGNTFLALNRTPTNSLAGHINVINTVNCVIRNNSTDACVAPFISVNNEGTVDNCIIEGNQIRTTYAGDAILLASTVSSSIRGNVIHMGSSTANGIHDITGDSNSITNNSLNGGASGIIIEGCANDTVQNNNYRNPSSFGIKIGPTSGTGTAADTLVSGNRVKSTTSGVTGLINGGTSTRLRQYGNHWNTPTPIADTGASTVSSAYA